MAEHELYRIDMEDGLTSFAMCEECTRDALASGVFSIVDDTWEGDDDVEEGE
jgi:hypothetical protein